MKRHGNLYEQIISIENLKLADKNARKGKPNQASIRRHNKNREENIIKLHHLLKDRQYKTSAYTKFKISDPKERIISRLPYYPGCFFYC